MADPSVSSAPIAEILVAAVSYLAGILTLWIRRQVKK